MVLDYEKTDWQKEIRSLESDSSIRECPVQKGFQVREKV